MGLLVVVGLLFGLFTAYVNGVGGIYPHDHGELDVTVDGESINFDQSEHHNQHPTFHFHEGYGQTWHHHPESPLQPWEFERMTVAEALATLDMAVTESTFTLDGTTYDDDHSETTVEIEVNDTSINPQEHLIHDEDYISITVES